MPRSLVNLLLIPVYAFAWLMAMAALATLWIVAPLTVEREK